MKRKSFCWNFSCKRFKRSENEWKGYLTEDTLSKALEENRTINNSKEALSDDITEQNKAYAKSREL